MPVKKIILNINSLIKCPLKKTLKLLHVKINGCKDIKMIKPEASRKTITRAFAERESQYFEGKRYDLLEYTNMCFTYTVPLMKGHFKFQST
jgi:hypothetical protein